MKNKTVLMAAVLAVATVLAVGLALLPGSVQDAQANPCSSDTGIEAGFDASVEIHNNCEFYGPTEIEEP